MIDAKQALEKSYVVRIKPIEQIIHMIESKILRSCNLGDTGCKIVYEELFEKDITNKNIYLSTIIGYLEVYGYNVEIKRVPNLILYIQW